MTVIPMMETEPGVFEASASASFAGIYQARFLARGVTLRGTPFTREQTTTSAVWRGGDYPYQPPKDSGDSKEDWCRLLTCVLSEKNLSREFEELAKRLGINLKGIRECLYCVSRRLAKTVALAACRSLMAQDYFPSKRAASAARV